MTILFDTNTFFSLLLRKRLSSLFKEFKGFKGFKEFKGFKRFKEGNR